MSSNSSCSAGVLLRQDHMELGLPLMEHQLSLKEPLEPTAFMVDKQVPRVCCVESAPLV